MKIHPLLMPREYFKRHPKYNTIYLQINGNAVTHFTTIQNDS